jgi:hypothetical protein
MAPDASPSTIRVAVSMLLIAAILEDHQRFLVPDVEDVVGAS